jgi:hypothetical protein
MTTTESTRTATVVPITEDLFSPDEQTALAGFLAAYSGLTRDAYALDLRNFTAWCSNTGCTCSRRGAQTSNASAARWSHAGEPARQAPVGCAPSPGSTALRGRGGTARALTNSARAPAAAGLRVARRRPGPQPRSGRCSSRLGSAHRTSTCSSRRSRSTARGSPKRLALTSTPSAWNADTAP